jgi:hypothetical protein
MKKVSTLHPIVGDVERCGSLNVHRLLMARQSGQPTDILAKCYVRWFCHELRSR